MYKGVKHGAHGLKELYHKNQHRYLATQRGLDESRKGLFVKRRGPEGEGIREGNGVKYDQSKLYVTTMA